MSQEQCEFLHDHDYLIIAGTLRAGTTSLFRYLADHPEVCASSVKETCFFLEETHYRNAAYRFSDGLDKYQTYFGHCSNAQWLRVEATPHYLHSEVAAQRIRSSLPNTKLLFVLRKPVERLKSSYRFACQLNTLPTSISSFDDYIRYQFDHLDDKPIRPPRALRDCRYSVHLKVYFDLFPRDALRVLRFNELREEPRRFLDEVCTFAGIDGAHYDTYDFEVHNPSYRVKHAAVHARLADFRESVQLVVHHYPRLYRVLRSGWRHLVKPVYLRLATEEKQQMQLSSIVHSDLESYFSGERDEIAKLVGEDDFSWD